MHHPINVTETFPPIGNSRSSSAKDKIFRDVVFGTIQIFFFVKKFCVEICFLLCAIFILCWKKRGRSKTKKVCKKTRRPGLRTLCEIAITSQDKINADLCMEAIRNYEYDVNSQSTSNKLTLFLCACMSGNLELMSFMIKRGADVKLRTAHGDSALYLATYGYLHSPKPDMRAISMLIAHGCNVNQPNYSGFTVLHQAAAKGDLSLTQYFILKGADPNLCNHIGLLPYHIAVIQGYDEVASFLKERMRPLSKRASSTV